jgi:hypothetical protein
MLEMDYRQLRDIGITREQPQQEARKPIWKKKRMAVRDPCVIIAQRPTGSENGSYESRYHDCSNSPGLHVCLFRTEHFLQFLHMGPLPNGPAGDFTKALFVSHYFHVVGALELAGGALCLVGRFVPLGLTLLSPVIVNILLFHILLNPAGLPMAIGVSVLTLIVLWYHRAAFAGLVKGST